MSPRAAGGDRRLLGRLNANVERLAARLEAGGFADYTELMHRPGKLMTYAFLAGLARGVGFFLGAGVMGAVTLGLLTWFVYRALDVAHDVPVLNQLVGAVRDVLREFLARHAGGGK